MRLEVLWCNGVTDVGSKRWFGGAIHEVKPHNYVTNGFSEERVFNILALRLTDLAMHYYIRILTEWSR